MPQPPSARAGLPWWKRQWAVAPGLCANPGGGRHRRRVKQCPACRVRDRPTAAATAWRAPAPTSPAHCAGPWAWGWRASVCAACAWAWAAPWRVQAPPQAAALLPVVRRYQPLAHSPWQRCPPGQPRFVSVLTPQRQPNHGTGASGGAVACARLTAGKVDHVETKSRCGLSPDEAGATSSYFCGAKPPFR